MRSLFIGGTKRGYLTVKSLVESGAEIAGILNLKQDEHERYELPMRALATMNGNSLPGDEVDQEGRDRRVD